MTLFVVRAMMDRTPAPRNVFVPFRLGQVFGRPGRAEQQGAVLQDAIVSGLQLQHSGERIELPHRLGPR